MKKSTVLKSVAALSLAFVSGVTMAAAPANLSIINNTGFTTNAYVHDVASPNVLGPHNFELIAWSDVTNLCHNTMPPLMNSSDPCAFEVYATNDPQNNPKQIDVGTVMIYLSDGHVGYVDNKAQSYGLKIVAIAPGQLAVFG